jgi:hypothetical protein
VFCLFTTIQHVAQTDNPTGGKMTHDNVPLIYNAFHEIPPAHHLLSNKSKTTTWISFAYFIIPFQRIINETTGFVTCNYALYFYKYVTIGHTD